MRHLRLAAAAAALLLGACYGAPEDVPPGSTTTGTTSAANTTGAGTSSTSANGGGTGQSTSAGYTDTDSTTTSTGSACAMPCESGADCPSQTGQSGPAVCLSSGKCEYTVVVGEGWITEDLCPSTQSATGTTGTSTTTGTSGSCGCQSDADCVAIYGSGATCSNGACWINGPNNGAIGGTTGCSTTGDTTTGSTGTSSTTGTTGTCGCQSDADCAQYGSGAVCQNGGCYISGPGTGTITGTTGCGGSSTTTTTGTTTGGACCTSDADCVATWGTGATCSNGSCYVSGPNSGTIGSTGCGGGNTSTSTSTTGSGCANPCSTVSDCPTFADASLLSCNGGFCYYAFTCSSTGGGGASVCPGTDPGGCGGTSSTTGGSSTPLVLAFDGAPVRFTEAQGRFELGQGDARTTDWVDARTPWLALDVNGNGRIDSGEELFGSLTRLPDGGRASNGFMALRALDANHDGRIDAQDPAFAKLVLWRDADQDRQSRPAELVSAARAGVVAIELGYATSDRCDARGNCERERAAFVYRTAQGELRRGEVVDVHLAHRPALLSVR